MKEEFPLPDISGGPSTPGINVGLLWQLKFLSYFGFVTIINLAKYIFNVHVHVVKIHHSTRFMQWGSTFFSQSSLSLAVGYIGDQ